MKLLRRFLLLTVSIFLLVSCNEGGSTSSAPTITYQTLNYTGTLGSGNSTGLTGIRQIGDTPDVYITGSYVANSKNNGTLYVGPILGGGKYYVYNYPAYESGTTANTNVYSADNGANNNVLLVGSYTTVESGNYNFGFLYNGPVAENNQESALWKTLQFPNSEADGTVMGTIPHSVMGGLVVGNYLTPSTAGNGFIYNISTDTYQAISYPGARYTSIYGIWANGGDSYTITGGYSLESSGVLTAGFVADYNITTKLVSNWTAYYYNNDPTSSILTHFEGITTDNNGGYNLAASGVNSSDAAIKVGFVNISRTHSGDFESTATWVNAWYPGSSITTGDTVYKNYLLGVYQESGSNTLNGYVATIPSNAKSQ